MSQPPAPSADGLLARQQMYTPYYGLVQLALATIAYTDGSLFSEFDVTKALIANVAGLPPLPAAPTALTQPTLPGTWAVEWGPCYDLDYSNLMYAATYREPVQSGYTQGAPVFTAVVIRGTDVADAGPGFITQLKQDLGADSTALMAMPAAGNPSLTIAHGTNKGLKLLLTFSPKGRQVGSGTIVDYVEGMYGADNAVPIVVTGHSLGGCQTTVTATYLYYALQAHAGKAVSNVVPNPYAPPTAGLADFAGNFDAIFPAATLWLNTLDVVPNAFAQSQQTPAAPFTLQYVNQLWGGVVPAGPPIPTKCLDLHADSPAKVLQDVIATYPPTYTQPTVGAQRLQGSVWAPPTDDPTKTCKNDWLTQLEIQHFPPMYHRLISALATPTVAGYPLPVISAHPNPCTAVPSAPA